MKVKYDRVSTAQQTGDRLLIDTDFYDKKFFDTISGTVPFKDRPDAKKLIELIEQNKIAELVVEEFSRLGRNTGDCINTLLWLENYDINVVVKNLSLQSRPNGKKNPLWNMVSSVMASLYELELENIKERTSAGRVAYVQKGGKLGRPKGSNERFMDFLNKESSKKIMKELEKNKTVREISNKLKVSTTTVMKVKQTLQSI